MKEIIPKAPTDDLNVFGRFIVESRLKDDSIAQTWLDRVSKESDLLSDSTKSSIIKLTTLYQITALSVYYKTPSYLKRAEQLVSKRKELVETVRNYLKTSISKIINEKSRMSLVFFMKQKRTLIEHIPVISGILDDFKTY